MSAAWAELRHTIGRNAAQRAAERLCGWTVWSSVLMRAETAGRWGLDVTVSAESYSAPLQTICGSEWITAGVQYDADPALLETEEWKGKSSAVIQTSVTNRLQRTLTEQCFQTCVLLQRLYKKCHCELLEDGYAGLSRLQPNLPDGFSIHKTLLTGNDRTV